MKRKSLKLIGVVKTHKQWDKWAIGIALLVIMILVNLLRGGKGADSIINLESCSAIDWIIQVVYLLLCASITYFTKNLIQKEA